MFIVLQIFIKGLAGTTVLEVAPSLLVDDVKAALQVSSADLPWR